MTREANVGAGCAVSSAMRRRLSASTFSSAGRACCASIRPKAGRDSNSKSGLFTAGILSDVHQHPGESGAASHESGYTPERAAPESPGERFAVGSGQEIGPSVHRISENIQGRRQYFGGAAVQHLPASGRTGQFPFLAAYGPVVVAIEARQ